MAGNTPNIITLTLNPAIDKNYFVERLVPDNKLRAKNPKTDAGGGGINVSKGLKRLGSDSLAMFPAGGLNGKLLMDILTAEGVLCRDYLIREETRESIMIGETETNRQFRVVAEGPEIPIAIVDQMLNDLKSLSPEYLIASGSLPKSLPSDTYARFASFANKNNCKFVLDTSGDALREAADEGVFLLKPNLNELSKLSGVEELELSGVDDAAMEIITKGNCKIVLVSMGASGAMLVTKDGYKNIPAPTVRRKSTVGAGDSVVAGMVWALEQNLPIDDVAAWGVACGTAATMNEGTQLFRKEDAEKLYNWIRSRT
jgi:6-phosphofructokinase 2